MQIVSGLSKFPNWKKMFPTVLQWAKMQTSFGSLCAPTVLLLGCVLVYTYKYIWIWICSQRPAASLLLSESANIGAHSDFSNDPKAKWSCKTAKTANMDLLVQHVMTHLAKCCQESFNYLNSKINCCGCRAKSSTVLLLAFQILWKISLWTGILPQADRAQHGFTELTVYWDIVSNKI